jgi:hypothetical protein
MHLKDYIHYYLGQKCSDNRNVDIGKIVAINKDDNACTMTIKRGILITREIQEIKPILHRLSDITLEHAKFVMRMVVHENVEYRDNDYRLSLNEYCNAELLIDNDWHTETMVFGRRTGSIWLKERSNTKIPGSVYHYLLQHGYDLFGLIDAGLAIDANTLLTENAKP